METYLNITKPLFLQRLKKQIDKAESISKIEIKGTYDYEILKKRHSAWDNYNQELLKRSFTADNNEYLKQYSAIRYDDLYINFGRMMSPDYRKEVENKTEFLKCFYDKIELIPCKEDIEKPTSNSCISDTINTTDLNMEKNNPWSTGLFYVSTFLIVAGIIVLIINYTSLYLIPIVILSSIIVVVIGLLQLKNDNRISDKTFLTALKEGLRRIKLIPSDKKK